MYILQLRFVFYSGRCGIRPIAFLGGWLSRRDVSVLHNRYACALDSIVMTSTACVYRTPKMGEYSSGFDETG